MSETKRLLATAAAVLASGVSASEAAHPLATEDAATVGAGLLEVEVAGAVAGTPDVADTVATDVGAALHVGIVEWLDLGVAFNLGLVPGTDGGTFAPMVDLKLRLVEAGGRGPGVALRLEYGLEGEAPGHGVSHGAAVQLALTLEGRVLDLHFNVSGGLSGPVDEPPDIALGAAAAALVHLGEHIDVGVELLVDADPVATAGAVGGTIGLGISLPEDLVLSGGLGLGWAAEDGVELAPTLGLTVPIDPRG